MAVPTQLDRTYHYILTTFVATGQAPHYIEIAREFGVPPEEGKTLLADVMGAGLPCWMAPDTDHIASFAPFNNQPTLYRVTVEGEQKWFAQCALEAMAMTWLFPGKTMQVDSPCLDCGDPIRVRLRDGGIEEISPDSACLYFNIPYRKWSDNLPFS